MSDVSQVTVVRLRQRAAHCRELARSAVSVGIAAELQSIADDYDRDALCLEDRRRPSNPTSIEASHG